MIGSSGTPFEVGDYAVFDSGAGGELYLEMNDNYFPDNSGYWTVDISYTPDSSNVPDASSTFAFLAGALTLLGTCAFGMRSRVAHPA